MENKILDKILYYYNYNEEGPILFDDSAYNLHSKLEILFNELKREIKNNLASENEGKIDYLNSFDKILFLHFSEEKFKSSKHFSKLHSMTGKIIIDVSLFQILKCELCLSGYTSSDDKIYEEQYEFIEFVKNYLLNDLYLFVKKIKKQVFKVDAKKMIKFIAQKKNKNSDPILVDSNHSSTEQKTNLIFKPEGSKLFELLLGEFNIVIGTDLKRGDKAKLNAIWCCYSAKEILFKNHTMLKEYVSYLNEAFNIKLNNRSLSDGSKYYSDIEKFVRLNKPKETSL